LDRAFEAANTTSPAGSILASIDASRALLASTEGTALLTEMADMVAEIRSAVRSAGVLSPAPA
jgi:arginine/lysine/ornithine decarboxylase